MGPLTRCLTRICLIFPYLIPKSPNDDLITTCRNDQNMTVEWFFIYKLPNGGDYVYVDSNTYGNAAHWTKSSRKIGQSNGALAYTIAPLTATENREDLTYAVYNDQQTAGKSNGGHTKGIFLFDKKTGVWLIHTVPRFPLYLHSGFYVYPFNGYQKGQIALCVTFPSTQLETIAKHLRLQHPNIYDSYAPASVRTSHPNLNLLLQKTFNDQGPWVMIDNLKDAANNEYISFSKHRYFVDDVYSRLVAPKLKSSLLVSTWRIGNVNKVPSYRDNNDLTVENVQKLTFKLDTQESVVVNNTVDHSKWAISESTDKPFVCVGTLNRVVSQHSTGGETLCFQNKLLHRLLRESVTDVEPAPRRRQRADDPVEGDLR